jgi:hypothetical protein
MNRATLQGMRDAAETLHQTPRQKATKAPHDDEPARPMTEAEKEERRKQKAEAAAEAYARIIGEPSRANWPAVFAHYLALGIPEEDIRPKENVFPVPAWNHLGRKVKAGQKACRVPVFVPDKDEEGRGRWRQSCLFHESQTEPMPESWKRGRRGRRG